MSLTRAQIAAVSGLLNPPLTAPAVDLGSVSGSTISIVPAQGTIFRCELDANISYVTWTGEIPTEYTFTLICTQGASGPYTFADYLTTLTNGDAIGVGAAAGDQFMVIYITFDGGSNFIRLQPGGGALS